MITEADLKKAFFAGYRTGIVRASYHRNDLEIELFMDEAMADPDNIFRFLTSFYNGWYCKGKKKGQCLSPDEIVAMSNYQPTDAERSASADSKGRGRKLVV